jgi:HEAT repeat protein
MAAIIDRRRAPILMLCITLAIIGCNSSAATHELIGQAHSKDSADRVKAVRALGKRAADADKVVPVLIELLRDDDAFVRRDAAHALGQIGSAARSAEPALLTATRDRNVHVRQAAAEAVQKVKSG